MRREFELATVVLYNLAVFVGTGYFITVNKISPGWMLVGMCFLMNYSNDDDKKESK